MTRRAPNIRTWDAKIESFIIEQDSCHCTSRVATSPTTVTATFNHNGERAAFVRRNHKSSGTTVSWDLPINAVFTRVIPYTATDDEIRAILLSGFLQMHTLWGGNEYSGLGDDV